VESLVMPATAPVKAVTTSNTCPTWCDTDFQCSDTQRDMCTQYGNACGTFSGCTQYGDVCGTCAGG
jgi:hypothetical protein